MFKSNQLLATGTSRRTFFGWVGLAGATALGVSSCANSGPQAQQTQGGQTVAIEDNFGTQQVPVPPSNVIATDNRIFETLAAWDVKLVAAPIPLLEPNSPYRKDSSIVDLGSHREPNLEAIVAANPGLILNGQRFASKYEDIKKLVPNTPMVELDPRDGQPFDAELKRQTTALGKIFNKTAEADQLNQALDASIEQVKSAYDPKLKVLAVIVSGGKINYAAPKTGRTLGPLYDIFGFTPAVAADGSKFDQGDEIAAEAIAAAKPDVILVMDRDSGLASGDKEVVPAKKVIGESPALQNVPAVKTGTIAYTPPTIYLNEGIQTYTTYFTELAKLLQAQR